MARKPTRAAAKKKQPAAVETSESIEEQTRRFLESGNKIQVIQSGVRSAWALRPKATSNARAESVRTERGRRVMMGVLGLG